MENREVFQKDPTKASIPNDGVAKVGVPESPEEWEVLRYELSSFVCEGEYEKGLERVLSSYLSNLDKFSQPAVWVSGFYGSGKSHFVRVLEYLWRDYQFSDDGATARGITQLPSEIQALFKELTTAGKRHGGLWSAAGKLGAGGGSIRLALLAILLRNAGLPGQYAPARLVIWLMQNAHYDAVKSKVESLGYNFDSELRNMYVSHALVPSLIEVIPDFASGVPEARNILRSQFPDKSEITDDELLSVMDDVLTLQSTTAGKLPCTLLVLDELQQFIGDDSGGRTLQVQNVVEACCSKFGTSLSFVATGQSALQALPQLQKLKDRFTVRVQLSDTDVERVVREVVLRKDSTRVSALKSVLDKASGEIDRQLTGTKIGPRPEDSSDMVPDYPLLPVRRRFWEAILRRFSSLSTAGQLRTQLRAVHEATKQVANKPLGYVVAGDVIFDQLKPDMLTSSILLPDVATLIDQQKTDGTLDGILRSRLCATIFLIGKLPTDGVLTTGIKATPESLADLLVQDLNVGSASLRQHIPELLKDLAEPGGPLMFVDGEYRLQTRESAEWESDYNQRFTHIRADDGRIASDRTTELKNAVNAALKGSTLTQGVTKTPRKYAIHYSADQPATNTNEVPVWVRDEWSVSEKTIREEAQAASVDSPIIFVCLPRQEPDALKAALASFAAARESLESHAVPTSPEGLEARSAMESRRDRERQKLDGLVLGIIRYSKVFQGGGNERVEGSFQASVKVAMDDALVRLFPRFSVTDQLGWDTVLKRASNGAADALSAVHYTGDTDKHPACQQIRSFIGADKSGYDIRKQFEGPPYGWPRDAIDGALVALVAGGFVRAARNGQPVTPKGIVQSQIGAVDFYSEETIITAVQRIGVRKLLADLGMPIKPNEEAEAIPLALQHLLGLAEQAGGDPPVPARPSTTNIQDLRTLGGNGQFVAVYEAREQLLQNYKDWTRARDEIKERQPRWQTLQRLLNHAKGLPTAEEITEQAKAIEAQRALLSEPDPLTPLIGKLGAELRSALLTARQGLLDTRQHELYDLEVSEEWQQLENPDRARILAENGLDYDLNLTVGTDEQLLATLDEAPLTEWDDKTVALPARVAKAREVVVRLVLPDPVPVHPRHATLKTAEDVETYLAQLREEIMTHIKEGKPVIL